MYLVTEQPSIKAQSKPLTISECTTYPVTEGICHPGPVNTLQSAQVHKLVSLASQRSEPEILHCFKMQLGGLALPVTSTELLLLISSSILTQNEDGVQAAVRTESETAWEAPCL